MRILGWLFMLACGTALGLLFGVKPQIAFYLAFIMLATNFATFCLLYDEPYKRARRRTEMQLTHISSKGVNAEEYQRLQSRRVIATADDRRFRLTTVSGLNIVSGIAGLGLLCWGLMARMFS